MRICEITGGVVTNVIELPGSYVIASDNRSASGKATYEIQGPEGSEIVEYDASYAAPGGAILVLSGPNVEPGWTWSQGAGFGEPEIEPAAPVLVPITRRQLRLTLLAHGLLDQVEPAIAALDEPERSVATIEWQDASEYRRDHPLIAQVGTALELDEAAIDAMWIEAMGH